MYVFGNIKIKTWIVNENQYIRLPRYNILLAQAHVGKDGLEMH